MKKSKLFVLLPVIAALTGCNTGSGTSSSTSTPTSPVSSSTGGVISSSPIS